MLRNMASYFAATDVSGCSWSGALRNGVEAMKFYGGATVGMRTMLDSLFPAVEVLMSTGDLAEAAKKSIEGMEATKAMDSLAGRSNYIQEDLLMGTPDPGAFAVANAFHTAAVYLLADKYTVTSSFATDYDT